MPCAADVVYQDSHLTSHTCIAYWCAHLLMQVEIIEEQEVEEKQANAPQVPKK